jgi:hypothetical protein
MVEKQVADDIDQMIKDDWLLFINIVIALRRFSAAFLRHIVGREDCIFFALCSAEVGYRLGIARLKSKIKGYKNAIKQTKHTIKQLGNGMAADTYKLDRSIKF